MAIPSKNIRAERITGSLDASGINMSGSFTIITATSFTGSLFGTASFANTASFVNPLTQSVSIRGTGTTSATTAFRVENANASASMVVLDNGNTTIGNAGFNFGSNLLTLVSNAGTAHLRVGGGDTVYFSSGVSSTVNLVNDYVQAIRFLIGSGNSRLTSTTTDWLSVTDSSQSSNGSGNLSVNKATFGTGYANIVASTQVQIKGSGTTSATTALRVENANASSSMVVLDNGNVGIGTTTPTSRLQVKGSGTTSATTTLRIENANTSASLVVLDNGDLTSNNNFVTINSYDATINGANKVTINGTNFGTGNIYRGVTSGFLTLGNDSTVSTGVTLYGSTHATLRDSIRINQSGSTVVTIVSGSVGIGTTTPAYKLDITGTARITAGLTSTGTNYLGRNYLASNVNINSTGDPNIHKLSNDLIINAGASPQSIYMYTNNSPILSIKNDGNVGIGTTTPSSSLDVSGSGRFTNGLTITGSLTVVTGSSIELQVTQTGVKIGNATTDSHSITGSVFISASFSTSSAALSAYKSGSTVLDIQGSQGQLFSVVDSLAGSLMSVNDISGLPILEVFSDDRIVMGTYGNPAMVITGSVVNVSSSFTNTVSGSTSYSINITPTFIADTSSVTQVALRVVPTFTGSFATSSLNSNIIADFGSSGIGSQLTINDSTSGSIYQINDISGLPIVDVTSDSSVRMYNFPQTIFEKTGSQVNIYGTLNATGSFVLPLSQSATPVTGSAYWSGSLLFVYDGTRYRSSSFA